ncbi:pyridoxamine 5'-phosphate oxidase family protein [Galbitalea soli]|uniref:pyridoxamine 5'-phosphate oxidase family protein n=1 Tax=Galbitalea soli TaxID=1268042 RepID=UPI00180FBD33|nr:pyridoxamine 5'-phosphate oxidase family protein [Galbitalea soli]NYJ31797.1 hypothetical protein [Galbitalea soli]
MSATARTSPTRMPEKMRDDRAGVTRLIADARVGHVAFVHEGAPRVMPIAIVADGDDVLLHGSTGSPWLRLLATGVPVSVAVTAVDALVVARSAFESSMHYRSAVLFGRCAPVDPVEKAAALDRITEALIPGRVSELRPHRSKELAATLLLRLGVEEWSYRVSDGWPEDDDADVAGPAWAGVLPMRKGFAEAIPTFDLREGIPVPASVRGLLAP